MMTSPPLRPLKRVVGLVAGLLSPNKPVMNVFGRYVAMVCCASAISFVGRAEAGFLSMQSSADTEILNSDPLSGFDMWANRSDNPDSGTLRVEMSPELLRSALVEFDLTGIPAGSTINSATFHFKLNGASDPDGVYVIIDVFAGAGLHTFPEFYFHSANSHPLVPPDSLTLPPSSILHEYDITSVIQSLHDSAASYATLQLSASIGQSYEIVADRPGFGFLAEEFPRLAAR